MNKLWAALVTSVFVVQTACAMPNPAFDPNSRDDETGADSQGDESDSSSASSTDSSGDGDGDGDGDSDSSTDTGETDTTGPDTDMGSPDMCEEPAKPQWVAGKLNVDCEMVFPEQDCLENEPLSRGRMVSMVLSNYLDESKLECFALPDEPTYNDVGVNDPNFEFVEQLHYFKVGPLPPFFEPEEPASALCWAEDILLQIKDVQENLGIHLAVAPNQQDQNYGAGLGALPGTDYWLCGTNPVDRLDFPIIVINDTLADFEDGQGEPAPSVESVRIYHQAPDGIGSVSTLPVELDQNGQATIMMLDAFSDSDERMEFNVQVYTAENAIPGMPFRLGISQDTPIQILGPGYVPFHDIQ